MAKYAIAFIVPDKNSILKHRILEGENRDNVLRRFFNEEVSEHYSNDDQGFYYFKEDFFEETAAAGSILECE